MKITTRSIDKVYSVANSLIEKYGTCNPYGLAYAMGIQINFLDFTDDLLAFSSKKNNYDTGTIYINKHLGNYASKILCAHEIGHLVMHKTETNLFDKGIEPKKEFEANCFSMCLIPTMIHTIPEQAFNSVEAFNEHFDKRIRYIAHSINYEPLAATRDSPTYKL